MNETNWIIGQNNCFMTVQDLVTSSKWDFVCANEIQLYFNCEILLIKKQCFLEISKSIMKFGDIWNLT